MMNILLSVALLLTGASAGLSLSIDQSDYKWVQQVNNALNLTGTNTYAQAINYGRTHPTRDGGSWSGW
jgi:flagellar basal body P-ring protein FlgI